MNKQAMTMEMMKQGLEAFNKLNKEWKDPADPLLLTMLPIILGCTFQATMYAHLLEVHKEILVELKALNGRR